jgi:hypothetical protein
MGDWKMDLPISRLELLRLEQFGVVAVQLGCVFQPCWKLENANRAHATRHKATWPQGDNIITISEFKEFGQISLITFTCYLYNVISSCEQGYSAFER